MWAAELTHRETDVGAFFGAAKTSRGGRRRAVATVWFGQAEITRRTQGRVSLLVTSGASASASRGTSSVRVQSVSARGVRGRRRWTLTLWPGTAGPARRAGRAGWWWAGGTMRLGTEGHGGEGFPLGAGEGAPTRRMGAGREWGRPHGVIRERKGPRGRGVCHPGTGYICVHSVAGALGRASVAAGPPWKTGGNAGREPGDARGTHSASCARRLAPSACVCAVWLVPRALLTASDALHPGAPARPPSRGHPRPYPARPSSSNQTFAQPPARSPPRAPLRPPPVVPLLASPEAPPRPRGARSPTRATTAVPSPPTAPRARP